MLAMYLTALDCEEDKNKFELLYMEYRKLMLYVANRILKDEHLAEDTIHQHKALVFLKQRFD